MRKIPFHFYQEEGAPVELRTDVLLVGITQDDEGQSWFVLPQFDIEVPFEADHEPMGGLIKRLVAFFAGLRELPPSHVNEVEQEQLRLLDDLLLPFLADVLGQNPQYWEIPTSVGAIMTDRDELATA